MPRDERTVRPAANQDDKARVKPQPPSDLWEQLEQAVQEACTPIIPASAFTSVDMANHFGFSTSSARRRINALRKAKRIGVVRISGINYYVLNGKSE